MRAAVLRTAMRRLRYLWSDDRGGEDANTTDAFVMPLYIIGLLFLVVTVALIVVADGFNAAGQTIANDLAQYLASPGATTTSVIHNGIQVSSPTDLAACASQNHGQTCYYATPCSSTSYVCEVDIARAFVIIPFFNVPPVVFYNQGVAPWQGAVSQA